MGTEIYTRGSTGRMAAKGIKYTRKDVHGHEVSHNDYMAQFVNGEVINYVLRGIGRAKIRRSKMTSTLNAHSD